LTDCYFITARNLSQHAETILTESYREGVQAVEQSSMTVTVPV